MSSLLLAILCIELAVHAVNTIGASTINNLVGAGSSRTYATKGMKADSGVVLQLWRLFLSLPTPLSRDFVEQRTLQQEYQRCRREMVGTSSQDEFAKWARLRRQHDKLLDQLTSKST